MQEDRWICIRIKFLCNVFSSCKSVHHCQCLYTSTFLNTEAYFCMHLWMGVCGCAFILIIDCGIPPPHWHLCTQSLLPLRKGARDKQKKQSKVRGCLLSQKSTTLSSLQRSRKARDMTHQSKPYAGKVEEEEQQRRKKQHQAKGSVRKSGKGREEKERWEGIQKREK